MSSPERSLTKTARLITILGILIVVATCALGQETSQYDRGTPPQHTAGVSSLGSYTSADLGTINVSNGSLNFRLLLASVGGRGFSLPLTLNHSSKVWSASRDSNWADETGNHPVAYADYADIDNLIDFYSRVAPGWTIGAAPTLTVRGNGVQDNPTSSCAGDFKYALTRLTVNLPDKGEIQFRDSATDGAPLSAQLDASLQCTVRDGNRGRHWHSTDGSGALFISDSDNGIVRGDLAGVLILSDGTRYRFVGLTTPTPGSPPLDLWDTVKFLARATSITGRNGNTISITYPASNEVRYTDQLGRVTKIQKNVPDPDNPSVTLAVLVTMPGYQGQNRYVKVKTAVMNQRYRPGINPTLPVINGDYDPMGWGLSWGTATRLFPQSHGLDARRIDEDLVLSELVLPDSRSVEFFYNQFGEVAEARLPTGGKVQYDYQYVSTLPAGKSLPGEAITMHFHSDVSDIERAVVARRIYSDGVSLDASWGYAYTNSTAQVTASSASGVVMLNQKHYFLANGRNLFPGPGVGIPVPDRGVDGSGYNLWSTGVERRTETLSANGAIVIAASEQDWSQRASINWTSTTYSSYQTENDNRVNEERKILETGQTARTTTLYDLFNNATETSEFDYDNTLKRRTVTSYSSTNLVNGVNYAADSIRLIRMPLQQSVYDVSGIEQARNITEYDIYTGDGNHDYLLSYASVTGHDTANYGVLKTTRGNATRIGSWIKSSNTYLYTYPRYDMLGNVVSAKDARGNISTINFADDFGDGSNPGSGTNNPATPTYALPTLITSPPPNAGEQPHTARSQYDFSTGLLTGFRDRNNIVTQTIYNDPFNRPTFVKSALGISGVENHASLHYAPATVFGITLGKNDVLTAKDQTTLGDATLRSWTVTDGFGRTIEAWSRDPQGDLKLVTNYDGLGRVSQTSNPFRPSLGETAIFTTTAYDLAGRVTTVTTPDNAVVTTSYIGNTVTVSDQINKQRKSVTDALGRLREVYEDPTGWNYLTSYSYDVLDNLTTVTQGSQTRTFAYDSLKRLTSAINPEVCNQVGALCTPIPVTYQYDNNGNLVIKTDARNVSIHFSYDALNRLGRRWYNGSNLLTETTNNNPALPSGVGTSEEANYFYDSQILPAGAPIFDRGFSTGRLVAATYVTGGSEGSYLGYDELGRPLRRIQRTGATNYQVSAIYNRASATQSTTNPSGRTVNYGHDTAGRTSSFSGNLVGIARTYSTGITYSPLGGMSKEQFGTDTPVYNKSFYNSRGQLSEIRVSTSYSGPTDTTWNRGAIINHYSNNCWGMCSGQSMTDNNGNLKKQEVYIPLNEQLPTTSYTTWWQGYDYDNLNRLKRVHEHTGNPSLDLQQEYVDYDPYGNRRIDPDPNKTYGVNNLGSEVETGTNRLYSPGDLALPDPSRRMRYDNAGNLVKDTYTGAGDRTYDAENRMTQAWGGANQQQFYTYNADGQRVRRKVNGVETWQIYGIDGELLAEYAVNAAAASPKKEYGYRNGQLLISAEAPVQGPLTEQNVAWTNVSSTIQVTGNTIQKVSGTNSWYDAGAISSQAIPAGDGYMEFTPGEINTWRMCGLGNADGGVHYADIDYAFFMVGGGSLQIYESGSFRGNFGTYAATDRMKVAVQGGVVKYYRNSTLLYTSTVAPTYPLKVDATLNTVWSALYNVVIAGSSNGAATINWLVADQLGTPRMIIDKTGSLASVKRHDYLPFGEELVALQGLRTTALGYTGDTIRQKFTQKERDNETGLDYFLARYYSPTQGRFTSPDEFSGGPEELYEFDGKVGHNPTFYAELEDPQSLNKYHYALNNPLRYIDPDGHQTTTTDRLKAGAADFITGVGRGISSSITFGASGAPQESDSLLNRAGQGVGTVLTSLAGRATIGGGVLIAGGSGGLALPVGGAAVLTGATVMVGATVNAVQIATTPMQQSSSGGSGSTLQPGPNAGDSIPARGPQRDFTPGERGAVNKAGEKTGCHTCGSKQPGTKSGNFVPDHQPPTGTNKTNAPQRLYPQCQNCSRKQGGEVRAAKAKKLKDPE